MPINSTPIARTYPGEQTPPQTDARLPADLRGSRGLETGGWWRAYLGYLNGSWGGRGRVPRICSVWGFGTGMGSIPESGPSPVRTGICPAPIAMVRCCRGGSEAGGCRDGLLRDLHAQGVRPGQGGQH